MFRKMRRFKQQTSREECVRVLTEEKRGALSVNGDDGYPFTVPVNFLYDEADNRIYFHGASAGHKAEAMGRDNRVCFTVWNQGFKKEGHWEWNATSVVVFGKVTVVPERAVVEEKLRTLALKYYPTREEVEDELASAIDRVTLYAIEIEHMTGKLVNEK